MFDAMKEQLARRRVLGRVRRRAARPWAEDPKRRHALVVLPRDPEEARPAWRFIEWLGLPPQRVTTVIPGREIAYAPVAFIGHVTVLEKGDLDRLGLPRKRVLQKLWTPSPDVAFCLAPSTDLAAAYLVGASPAAFRVGLYSEGAEPFFDLLSASETSTQAAIEVLKESLLRIRPPVLDLPEAG